MVCPHNGARDVKAPRKAWMGARMLVVQHHCTGRTALKRGTAALAAAAAVSVSWYEAAQLKSQTSL